MSAKFGSLSTYCLCTIGTAKTVHYTGSGVSRVAYVLKSMEGQSGLSELSVIVWVSAIQGCPLSGVPL